MSMSKKSKIIIYVLLTLMALYFLSPFIYMLFTTFKTEAEAIAYPPRLFPKKWLVDRCMEGTAVRAVSLELHSGNGWNHGGTDFILFSGSLRICKISV